MALVYRNGRAYLYRSVRRNGRVTSEYRGSGEVALLIEQLDVIERNNLDSERFQFQAEREVNEAAERPLRDYFVLVEDLARAALIASGYHQHKREWRKRRGRPQETRETAEVAPEHRDERGSRRSDGASGEGG